MKSDVSRKLELTYQSFRNLGSGHKIESMQHEWKGKYPPKYKLDEMLRHKYRPEIQGKVKSITYDSNFQTYRYDIGVITINESFLIKAPATK